MILWHLVASDDTIVVHLQQLKIGKELIVTSLTMRS